MTRKSRLLSHATLTLALGVALTLVASTQAFGQNAPAKQTPAAGTPTTGTPAMKQPSDPMEPVMDFHRARENFLRQDFAASAAELRKGANFLTTEAKASTGKSKDELAASAAELDRLASLMEAGGVESARDLDDAFARAHRAMAMEHRDLAKKSWAAKDTRRTGHELRLAAMHTENAVAWTGKKVGRGTLDVLKGARFTSGKLIEGTGYVDKEVGKAIDDLGKEIEKVGKKIS